MNLRNWKPAGPSAWMGIFILFIILYSTFNQHTWDRKDVIQHDVRIYYEMLPAVFEHHDPFFAFEDSLRSTGNYDYWTFQDSVTGKRYMKYTIGVAYLFTPAFLAVKAYGGITNQHIDSFDVPYHFAVVLSTVIFAILGLVFSRKLFKHFFSDQVSALLLLILFLATGIWHYTVMSPGYGHVFSFALISMSLWYSLQYSQNPRWRTALMVGFLLGLITLIRPTNLLVFIVVFYFIPNNEISLYLRFKYWLSRLNHWIPALVCFLIPIIPQLIIWKIATNHWVLNSYGKETFYFLNPHILEGLFSFRNGLFIYSPILLLFFPSLYFLYKNNKSMATGITIFFVLNCYVMYSWWCWWYGGSFGSRPQIDSLIITVLPIGFLFQYAQKRRVLWVSAWVIAVSASGLNCFQSYQAEKSLIHWDAMTRSAYISVFGSHQFSYNYQDLIKNPDYEGAVVGNEYPVKIDNMYSNGVTRINAMEEFPCANMELLSKWTDKGVTKLYGTIFFQKDEFLANSTFLVMSIENGSGETLLYKSYDFNEQDHAWFTWHVHKMELPIPVESINEKAVLKYYIWNPNHQVLTIKNMKITNF